MLRFKPPTLCFTKPTPPEIKRGSFHQYLTTIKGITVVNIPTADQIYKYFNEIRESDAVKLHQKYQDSSSEMVLLHIGQFTKFRPPGVTVEEFFVFICLAFAGVPPYIVHVNAGQENFVQARFLPNQVDWVCARLNKRLFFDKNFFYFVAEEQALWPACQYENKLFRFNHRKENLCSMPHRSLRVTRHNDYRDIHPAADPAVHHNNPEYFGNLNHVLITTRFTNFALAFMLKEAKREYDVHHCEENGSAPAVITIIDLNRKELECRYDFATKLKKEIFCDE